MPLHHSERLGAHWWVFRWSLSLPAARAPLYHPALAAAEATLSYATSVFAKTIPSNCTESASFPLQDLRTASSWCWSHWIACRTWRRDRQTRSQTHGVCLSWSSLSCSWRWSAQSLPTLASGTWRFDSYQSFSQSTPVAYHSYHFHHRRPTCSSQATWCSAAA